MSTTITPTEQNIEINVNNDVIDINVTNEIVDVNATTQQIDINVAGAYPIPNPVLSVFGRTGVVVATEGDYTLTQLGDVTLTSPTNGQVLKYNGTTWVNGTDAGGLTSVGLSMPTAFTVTNSPLTSNGTIAVTGAGTTAQYVRGDGTLATFPSIITQAQNLVTEVYNRTGATLTKGTIVYINGGQGNLPTVTKALAVGDSTSAQTYGVVQTDITNMNNGYVVVAGRLSDLDTQAYTEGTQLYLSSTTAGTWTSTKQYAPNHLVYVGIVVRAHPTQGIVEIKIQNGYELDEIHNVAAQTPTNNDGLFWESATNLWKNKSIATILGGTPVTGTGTTNYLAKFTGSSTIGIGQVLDDGTSVLIGTTSSTPNVKVGIYSTTQRALEVVSTNSNALFVQSPAAFIATISNGTWVTNFTNTGRLDLAGDLLVNTIANATTDTDRFLVSDSGVIKYRTGAELLSDIGGQGALTNPITGTGTSGQVAYFNGTNSITSNAAFAFTPTSQLLVNNSVTAASAIARGTNLTPTLTAAANNDVLVGLDINPTFTNGAFTGVTNYILRGFGANGANVILGGQQNNSGTSTINIYGTNRLDRSAFITATAAGSFSNNVLNFGLNYFDGTSLLTDNYITLSARTTTINFPFLLNNPLIYPSSNNTNSSLSFGNGTQNVRGAAIFAMASGASGITARLDFAISNATNPSVTTSDVAMSLFNSKNFGIGTTTDAGFRLDVNGTARVQNTLSVGNSFFIGLNAQCSFERISNVSRQILASQNIAGARPAYLFGVDSVQLDRGLINNRDGAYIALVNGANSNSTNYTERLIVFNNGNIAINTATDAGYRLDVNGTFRQTGSTTAASAIARGSFISPTLVAAANNDVLVGLDINPTFTNGAFTGVRNVALRATGLTIVGLDINKTETNAGFIASAGNHYFYVKSNSSLSGEVGIRRGIGGQEDGVYRFLFDNANAFINYDRPGQILSLNCQFFLAFNTNGTEKARFVQNGNLLLNTTTDAGFRLDVNGTARVQSTLTVGTTAIISTEQAIISGNTSQLLRLFNTGTTPGTQAALTFTTNSSNTSSAISAILLSTGNQTLSFLTPNAGSVVEKLRIWDTGNVLIQNGGTFTDSGFRLDVNGTTRLQSTLTVGGTALISTEQAIISNNAAQQLRLYNSATTAGTQSQLTFTTNTNGAVSSGISAISLDNSGNQTISILTPNAGTSGERLRVWNTGNVHIQNGGTYTDVASSILTLNSTTKGFLPPRMTTTQKNAIATPATGLAVYDTTLNQLSYYNGTSWINV